MSLRALALVVAGLAAGSGPIPRAAVADASARAQLETLEKRLAQGDGRERREAVSALAELASPAAWAAVLRALRDADAMVADQAQLELGRTRDAATRAALFGRDGLASGDALVRERAAELVGRLPEGLEPAPVAKALGDKLARVRRLACWSVERQGRAEQLAPEAKEALAKALEKLVRREDEPGVRAAGWSALWALGALAEERLASELLVDEATEVRAAALRACATLPAERALAALAPALADASRALRAVAIEGVARLGSAPAARALAARLAEESDKRLAWRIVEQLRALSGLRHARAAGAWLEWAGTLADDWRASAGEGRAQEARDAREESESVAFAGLPLLSERVLVLVDLSGSMGEAREGEATRKERAQAELARTLSLAPPTVRFDLVPYAAEPRPWKGELVAVGPKSTQQALAHLEQAKTGGPGDLWRALVAALAIEEADTVLLFGDGRPSGGAHWNLELIGSLWGEATRFRPCALDAVLVRPGAVERPWRRICADSGGRMLVLE